eukprot:g392.t1
MALRLYEDAGRVVDRVRRRRVGIKDALYNSGSSYSLPVLKGLVCKTLALEKYLAAALAKSGTRGELSDVHDAGCESRVDGVSLCLAVELLRYKLEGKKFKAGGKLVTPLKRNLDAIESLLLEEVREELEAGGQKKLEPSEGDVRTQGSVATGTSRERVRRVLLGEATSVLAEGGRSSSNAAGAPDDVEVSEYSYFRINPRVLLPYLTECEDSCSGQESGEALTLKRLESSLAAACEAFLRRHGNGGNGGEQWAHQDELVPLCFRVERKNYAEHVHPLAENGDVIVQDRSSQFSGLAAAECLFRDGKCGAPKRIVEVCSAPGSKTSHLIHMLLLCRSYENSRLAAKVEPALPAPEDTVVAIERDPARFCTLLKRLVLLCGPLREAASGEQNPVRLASEDDCKAFIGRRGLLNRGGGHGSKSGGKGTGQRKGKGKKGKNKKTPEGSEFLPLEFYVEGQSFGFHGRLKLVLCQGDFLAMPESCKRPDLFQNVDVLLLDPSCSGSGLAEHSAQHLQLQDGGNITGLSPAERERVDRLAQFQTRMLAHGLARVGARSVFYSTCSVYGTENEQVVRTALLRAGGIGGGHKLDADGNGCLGNKYAAVKALPFKWPETRKMELYIRRRDHEVEAGMKNRCRDNAVEQENEDLFTLCAHSLPLEHSCRGFFLAKMEQQVQRTRKRAPESGEECEDHVCVQEDHVMFYSRAKRRLGQHLRHLLARR